MRLLSAALLAALLLLTGGCHTNPVTGRSGVNLLPDSELHAMAFQQYSTFLNTANVVRSSSDAEMVRRVGTRIQQAVEQYMAQKGLQQSLNGYQWEFNLVNDPNINAWCMPGGKVVVYSGILPVALDEAGLAVVMGHEIAHAIAKHGNERMSQGLVTQLGGMALGLALQNKRAETQALFMQAYAVGSQLAVLLPFSRTHESEADRMGLIFMAMAGYNPEAAVPFWQRMGAKGGATPPEFLSTHPSPATRVNDLNGWMQEAKTYYKPR